jgi:hypothetical protein
MPNFRLKLLLVAALSAGSAAAQQPLICPTAPAGRACDAYHFHVQAYRPDTRQFTEVYGINQFASQAACDRARDLHVARSTKTVEYFRGIKEQHEGDRVGPCHCDMTTDPSAPNHLTDAARLAQVRTYEEIRLRVREKLLDNRLTTDAELVRSLWSPPAATAQLGGPKLPALPQPGPVSVATNPDELRATRTIDTSRPAAAALDVPLVDIGTGAQTPPAEAGAATTEGVTVPAATTAGSQIAVTVPAGPTAVPDAQEEEVVVAAPLVTEPSAATAEPAIEATIPEEDIASAQETAEQFISYETQRIQNVLRASAAIADENVKSRIFEACMQRIQLLSNLRLLIEGSGMRGRLAAAARDANDEAARLAVIAKLFGEDITPHWAPSDAADVIFEVDPNVAAEPERVLRDTTGRVSTADKKRALYLLLAQSQTTEDARLWLSSIIEGFLK